MVQDNKQQQQEAVMGPGQVAAQSTVTTSHAHAHALPPPAPPPIGNGGGFMESFKEKLNEIRKAIEDDKYRRRVLMLCQQIEPRSFDEYSSSGSFRKLEKFESSTYSEVLKAVDLADNNKPVVMKIMRALSKNVIKKLPSVATKGCQSYNDILNELVVTQALSQLHDGVVLNGKPTSLYKTHSFCLIHEIKVVSGNLERTLSKSQAAAAAIAAGATITNPANPILGSGHNTLPMTNDEIRQQQQQQVSNDGQQNQQHEQAANDRIEIKDDDLKNLSEDDRMLMEALPYEYVVSVMRHDGQPLWWMMTHKKLTAEQLTSVLVQVIVGLAIAEKVYLYEHRDLHVSNILIKKTSKSMIPFILDGHRFNIISHNIKATIIDATFSRLTHNGKVYFRDLTSTLRAYGSKKTPTKMSLQNRSYREMVHVTNNNWEDFTPKTNLIWLTYLCETLMKNEIMKANVKLTNEIKKIRDYTLKVNTTLDLLGYFPFDKDKQSKHSTTQPHHVQPLTRKATVSSSSSHGGSHHHQLPQGTKHHQKAAAANVSKFARVNSRDGFIQTDSKSGTAEQQQQQHVIKDNTNKVEKRTKLAKSNNSDKK